MDSITLFSVRDIRTLICFYLSMTDIMYLGYCCKSFRKMFCLDYKKKLAEYQKLLKSKIFARHYYPESVLDQIYEKEEKTYRSYNLTQNINIYWKGEQVGFAIYIRYSLDRHYWVCFFGIKEGAYQTKEELPSNQYYGCKMKTISFRPDNNIGFANVEIVEKLGFAYSSPTDRIPKNYATFEIIKDEIIAHYLAYNKINISF